MIVKTCGVHGDLTEDDCYVHRRKATVRKNGTRLGARVDLECRRCVADRAKSASSVKKRRHRAKTRYASDEAFQERRKQSEKDRYELYGDRIRLRVRLRSWRIRMEAIDRYSSGTRVCVRCGENDLRFLALDHVEGDGREHRKTFSGTLHAWARSRGWPPMFQVLCHNCNHLKALASRPVGRSKSAAYVRALREEVLRRYSDPPQCALCPVDDPRILTIDHVEGGGAEHRRRLGGRSSARLHRWLRDNGYPEGFRVLCQNHNLGREIVIPEELAA